MEQHRTSTAGPGDEEATPPAPLRPDPLPRDPTAPAADAEAADAEAAPAPVAFPGESAESSLSTGRPVSVVETVPSSAVRAEKVAAPPSEPVFEVAPQAVEDEPFAPQARSVTDAAPAPHAEPETLAASPEQPADTQSRPTLDVAGAPSLPDPAPEGTAPVTPAGEAQPAPEWQVPPVPAAAATAETGPEHRPYPIEGREEPREGEGHPNWMLAFVCAWAGGTALYEAYLVATGMPAAQVLRNFAFLGYALLGLGLLGFAWDGVQWGKLRRRAALTAALLLPTLLTLAGTVLLILSRDPGRRI